MAFPVLYRRRIYTRSKRLVCQARRRRNTRTTGTPKLLLQNLQQLRRLQSLEKRAELGIGECKGPLLGYFMLVVMFLTLLC